MNPIIDLEENNFDYSYLPFEHDQKAYVFETNNKIINVLFG